MGVKMRKLSLLVIIVMFLISCTKLNKNMGTSVTINADDMHSNRIVEDQLIRLAGSSDWNPYQLTDQDGNPTGMGYEVLELIIKPLGFETTRTDIQPFRRQLELLEIGDIDVFVGLYFTEDRNDKYVYTRSFATDEICVFVKKDSPIVFEKYEDLIGYTGIIPDGATYGDQFETMKDSLTIREINDKQARLDFIINGEADYYISAYSDVMNDIKEFGYENEFDILEKRIEINEVYFVISKASELVNYLDLINASIESMTVDGTIEKIEEKY